MFSFHAMTNLENSNIEFVDLFNRDDINNA